MKKLIIFVLMPFMLFAYTIDTQKWGKQSFLEFLSKYNLPSSIYYKLLPNDVKKEVRVIRSSREVWLLKNGDDIKQALIPFNDKRQIQIIKKGDSYIVKIVKVSTSDEDKLVTVDIHHFLGLDILNKTHNPYLAPKIENIFSDRINFNVLPPHTSVEVFYNVKKRFGEIMKTDVKYVRIYNRSFDETAYKYTDDRYYDKNGRSLKGMFIAYPIKFLRISSPFGMRYHPILHKEMMHDGVDLVNKIGTPVHSVAAGKVVYRGWMRGYGNTVEIKHRDGYLTLYGHLNGFANIKLGQEVSQGQLIAYLGNTGRSTGPHLHFGVMLNGKWINPNGIKKSAKITLKGRDKKAFLAYIETMDDQMSDKLASK